MIQKNIALSENYGNMMCFIAEKLAEWIILHMLHSLLMNWKMHHTRKPFQFLLHIFPPETRKKATVFGILNLTGKNEAEITDVIQKFVTAKSLRINTILFRILKKTNSTRKKWTAENKVLLSIQHLYWLQKSPSCSVLTTFNERYEWITSKLQKSVLDCLLEILKAIKQICINTNKSEFRGYRYLMMDHKVLFFIYLMAGTFSNRSPLE